MFPDRNRTEKAREEPEGNETKRTENKEDAKNRQWGRLFALGLMGDPRNGSGIIEIVYWLWRSPGSVRLVVWLDKLDVSVIFSYEIFNGFAALVVEYMQFRCMFACLQKTVYVFECVDHALV